MERLGVAGNAEAGLGVDWPDAERHGEATNEQRRRTLGRNPDAVATTEERRMPELSPEVNEMQTKRQETCPRHEGPRAYCGCGLPLPGEPSVAIDARRDGVAVLGGLWTGGV